MIDMKSKIKSDETYPNYTDDPINDEQRNDVYHE